MENGREERRHGRFSPATYEEFLELCRQGTVVPVVRRVMADMLTPVSAFLRIAGKQPYAFLLESVEGGEKWGRYSFLGADPRLIFRSRGAEGSNSPTHDAFHRRTAMRPSHAP